MKMCPNARPPMEAFDPAKIGEKARFDPMTGIYTNYRTSRGFPLGGIGTGGFRMHTDGGFGAFSTNHNWFQPIPPPKGTFFALWAQEGDRTWTKMLRGSVKDGEEYKNIDSIGGTKFVGEIPCFNLEYHDEELPVEVKLTGFSPLIPHNTRDSSLPIACFRFSVKNPRPYPVTVSLLFSFQNILGLGGSGGSPWLTPLDGPVKYSSTRKNIAEKWSADYATGIKFKTGQACGKNNPKRRTLGEYLIFFKQPGGDGAKDFTVSHCTRWDANREKADIIEQFSVDGTIEEQFSGPGLAGAVAAKFPIPAQEEYELEAFLVWWTPHHVIEKAQRLRRLIGGHLGIDYGHYYLNFFEKPDQLVKYVCKESSRLQHESLLLGTILRQSSLPPWLIRYILNSADSVLSNSILTKKGELYTIEGVDWKWPFGGLTGTNDQRLSSHPFTATFFPEIDLTELVTFRDLSFLGRVTHGNGNCDVMLHTANIPYGHPIKFINKGKANWVDLSMSEILQLGKYIISMGDGKVLRDSWEKLLEMLDFLERVSVDGVPEGITTYDVMLYEPCFIYTATLYLATLRMMDILAQKMAQVDNAREIELDKLREKWDEQFTRAEATLNAKLWHPDRFYQSCAKKPTVFTGALAGDWAARLAGLAPVVDYEKAYLTNQKQMECLAFGHTASFFRGEKTMPLPYLEADLSGNEVTFKSLSGEGYEGNYIWQTLSYQALEAIYLGNVADGLNLLKMVFDKGFYEGYPWDMNLFGRPGFVYMTHPVMWATMNALTGGSADAFAHSLTLSPRYLNDQEPLTMPLFLPKMWLMIKCDPETNYVEIRVLESFDDQFTLDKVIFRDTAHGAQEIPLSPPFPIKRGQTIKLKMP